MASTCHSDCTSKQMFYVEHVPGEWKVWHIIPVLGKIVESSVSISESHKNDLSDVDCKS
jgi:hypothetical protein